MVYSTVAVTWFMVYVSSLQVLAHITPDPKCKVSKGCHYFGCTEIDPNDCQGLISWVNFKKDSVLFTIKGLSDFADLWFALGFSDDHNMGNDSVTGCKFTNGVTKIFNAMNGFHRSPEILSSEGVTLVSSSFNNNIFECTFKRLIAAGAQRFGLNQSWYLLVARGRLLRNDITYHGPYNAFPSDEKYFPQFPVQIEPSSESSVTETNVVLMAQPVVVPSSMLPQPAAMPSSELLQLAEVASSVLPQSVKTPFPMLKGCGRTVGCYSDCMRSNCGFIVSWRANETHAIFTITSNVDNLNKNWIAIAFSEDDEMGDDDVMGCLSDDANNVFLFLGKNRRHDSPAMYTDNDIQLLSQNTENSRLSCTFVRPIKAGVKRVDVSEPWTVFFAKGSSNIRGTKRNIFYHEVNNYNISSKPLKATEYVDLRTNFSSEELPEYPLVKAHGCLMISAWVFMASVGLVVARYYKQVLNDQIFSEHIWFQIHRTCMALAFILSASGFIIIFIEVDGYSNCCWESMTFLEGHPIIGIVVMTFTLINKILYILSGTHTIWKPIMAIFRPHPGTPRRPIFNWAHWFIGTSTPILAVVNIFFGFLMTKSNAPYYVIYIMGAFVAWQVFVQILLEALTWFGKRRDNKEIVEVSNSNIPVTGQGVESPRIILIKEIVLLIHFIAVAIFAAALVILLARGKNREML